jgi:hypothetical protein
MDIWHHLEVGIQLAIRWEFASYGFAVPPRQQVNP